MYVWLDVGVKFVSPDTLEVILHVICCGIILLGALQGQLHGLQHGIHVSILVNYKTEIQGKCILEYLTGRGPERSFHQSMTVTSSY